MSFIIADGGLERLLRIIGKGSEMVDPKKDQDVRGKLLQLMPQEREPPEDGRLENPRWWHKQTVKKETSKQNNQPTKQTNEQYYFQRD